MTVEPSATADRTRTEVPNPSAAAALLPSREDDAARPLAEQQSAGGSVVRAAGRLRSGGWWLLTAVTVVLAAAVPLLWQRRFYFYGDTQIGSFGQWFHLGQELRAGHWPLMDPQSWASGNLIGEGQWGLFSPLTLGIGLLATVVGNAVIFVTLLKVGLLVAGATGTYLLLRSYGTPGWLAYVGGLAATTGGATQYLESPSWVTGQMVWALLPLFWWQLRRVVLRRANPAPALVLGFLLVTVGYVYGTLYLGVAVTACMLDAFLARDWRGVRRMVLVGVLCGLVAVTVYLPAVLTAPVTVRGGVGVKSDGPLQGTLPEMVTAMLPFFAGPGTYVAWFLPALSWVDAGRARRALRPLAGLLFAAGILLAWVLGPNQIGPIRWPLRVMPILTTVVVVFTVVLLSRAALRRPSWRRLLASVLVTVAAGFLAVSRNWDLKGAIVAGLALVLVGLAGAWFLLRRAARSDARPGRGGYAGLALFLGCWTVLAVVLQHSLYQNPPSMNRHMPSAVADYAIPLAAAQGDVWVVGDPEQALIAHPSASRDFLIAASWFVSPHVVQNKYTTIGYATYNRRYCIHYNGATCRAALTILFGRDRATGRIRADLLGVSTLQIYRKDFSERRLLSPPAGWHVAARSTWAVTWVRNTPLPTAGGVTWASSGVRVTEVDQSARQVRLRVDSAPAKGGMVVFSRLAWPGYAVQGASLALPTDDYLLTVAVPASSHRTTVTVRFDPPGWRLEIACLVVALAVGLLWCVGAAVRRRPRVTPPRGDC